MKIYVSSALKAPEIVDLLTAYHEDGVSFSFVKKTGLTMEFDVTGTDADSATKLIKSLIGATSFGPALYFSVSTI